mmetsp:Transcript_29138/g.74749  ORF Transcript_29138/g.74749 Transcript_29138/m.74749 type:complete len:282 (+) Transcript_29138:178-1023(+)
MDSPIAQGGTGRHGRAAAPAAAAARFGCAGRKAGHIFAAAPPRCHSPSEGEGRRNERRAGGSPGTEVPGARCRGRHQRPQRPVNPAGGLPVRMLQPDAAVPHGVRLPGRGRVIQPELPALSRVTLHLQRRCRHGHEPCRRSGRPSLIDQPGALLLPPAHGAGAGRVLIRAPVPVPSLVRLQPRRNRVCGRHRTPAGRAATRGVLRRERRHSGRPRSWLVRQPHGAVAAWLLRGHGCRGSPPGRALMPDHAPDGLVPPSDGRRAGAIAAAHIPARSVLFGLP